MSSTILESDHDHRQITFIFILILFIDSVNRVYRVQIELAMATENGTSGGSVSRPV